MLYWEDFPKRVRVELNGAVVADSRRVKALHETGHMMVFYFPREDVDMRLPEPLDEARTIPDFVCFYADKVHVVVDGAPLDS